MIDLGSWLRVAWIDLRFDLRKFAVLLVCLALGVATIATVGSVGAALDGAIGRDARSFLGGDLEASIGYRPANPAERALFQQLGKLTEVVEITARATAGTQSALIGLRGIDAAYPLVGAVTVKPAAGGPSALPQLLAPQGGVYGAVADPLLFDRLGIKPGDVVRIGNESYRLAGTLVSLPDQAARGFAIGATVLVSAASLPQTDILQPGVLARYRYKIALAGISYAEAAKAIKTQFPDAGWQVRSPREATASLTRFLDIFDRFLVLVGLSSLLVGGIGVSNAASAYISERERSIATLRSLGATSARIIVHFLVQIMLLGIVGTFAGLVLGAVSTLIVLPVLGGYLSIALPPAIYPLPLAIGAGFGLLVAFVFAYLPLLGAARLRPAALFRAAGGLAQSRLGVRGLLHLRTGGPLIAGILALVGLALLTTADWHLVAWYLGGAVGAFVLLRGAAWLTQWLVRRVPAGRWLALRLALRNIHRPGSPAPVVMLSLGLGLALMVGLALTEESVRGQLNGQLTVKAPSFVLMNVDKPTVTALAAFAKTEPAIASLSFTPFLRGIVTKLNGVAIADLKGLGDAATRLVGGDQALSWSATLPEGDRVLEGQWWAASYNGPPLVSIDEDFATPLKLKVGDSMVISISGRPLTARIANIRHVNWQNASLSFNILFSPGLIESAPATSMGSLKTAPADVNMVEAALVKNFPTLGFIPVSDVLAQISAVVGSLANAVAVVSAVALLSGVFVLAGALAAGRRQREADAVIAKVLGATRGDIALAYLIEYGLLGLLATLVAAALGAIGGWAIVTRLLQLEFAVDLPLLVGTAGAAILATIFTGLATTWSALSSRPAAFLRAEE